MGKNPIPAVEDNDTKGIVNHFYGFIGGIARPSGPPPIASSGSLLSITRLAEDSALSRQAITKHLRVLQEAGLVRGVRRGRENLFELEPGRLDEARRAQDVISRQWDAALARLKGFVEE
jgi:DNA-binding transcriptional ArsR family regulator